ncbi:hypothetical protein DFJ77DRAFT_76301 [Powellomyces hirtus]|nr:hypothetical protein DFJ77DRAFT_76301 [Powellomyces hirtus]
MGEADVHALDEHKLRILNETKNVSSFVVIGQTLHKLYYEDKLMKTQKEFLEWTKAHLGFSKSTTYEYIISYRIYSDIASKLAKEFRPPMYQSHCQLLSKVPSKKLVDTWVDVCRQAPNGVITTAFLETYLETNNLKVPKSRIASHGCCSDQQTDSKALLEAVAHAKAAIQGSSSSNLAEDDAGGRSSRHPGTGHVDYPTATPRKHGAKTNTISPRHSGSSDGKRIGKHARDDQDILPEPAQRRKTEPDRSQDHNLAHYHPGPVPLPTPMPSNLPVLPPPTDSADDDSDPSDEDARPRLPFNDGFIFELSKNVVMHPQFDMIMQTVADFKAAEQQPWFGRLWCNLSAIRPFSTTDIYGNPANHQASYEGGLERLLEIIFTKFANKEFHEGLFLLRGEFGADWFTPILQHPYCILRHNNPPMAAPPHSDDNGGTSPASASAAYQNGRASNSSARPPPVHTPYETYVMFYLGPNIKEFCTVFRSVGLVPGINSWYVICHASVSRLRTYVSSADFFLSILLCYKQGCGTECRQCSRTFHSHPGTSTRHNDRIQPFRYAAFPQRSCICAR